MRSYLTLPILVFALTALAGCAAFQPKVIDTGCVWASPIYVSKADILTDGTATQILKHNETGKRLCGWKRATKK